MTSAFRSAPVAVPLLIVLLCTAMLLEPVADAVEQIAADLPLSNHAKTTHQGQTWTAAAILEYMASGKCIPQEHRCMGKDFDIVTCEIKPGLTIGLVIGRTIHRVVTGFAARSEYWEGRCK